MNEDLAFTEKEYTPKGGGRAAPGESLEAQGQPLYKGRRLLERTAWLLDHLHSSGFPTTAVTSSEN